MTDYAAMVTALKARLGTWRRVAKTVNGKRLRHSFGYYQQVATGRIEKPSEETAARIESALACPTLALTSNVSKDTRKTVHLSDDDFEAGNSERERLLLTWPEMQHLWRLAYEREATE